MERKDASIYTDNELETLERYKQLRNDMIEHMVKDGTPDSNRDKRLLNELITSGEKNIQETASNRLKQQENLNKEAMAEEIAGVLRSISSNIAKVPNKPLEIELGSEYVPDDIVPGETDINPEKLDLESFTGERK